MRVTQTKKGTHVSLRKCLFLHGTERETRTLKGVNPADFESAASTNSAIPACEKLCLWEVAHPVNRFKDSFLLF